MPVMKYYRTEVITGAYEWERFLPRLLKSGEQQTFIQQGYVQIKGLWNERFAEALSEEARCVLTTTNPLNLAEARPRTRRRRNELSNQTTVAQAPILAHLHFSCLPLARALTGRMLVPAHAWYNFYMTNDGIWLHVDTEGSELVLLTSALGDAGPLHLHPELRGKTQDELEAIQNDPKWEPESGVSMAYPPLGLLAHRGHVLPHHRPGRVVCEPCAVAALHYISLF